MDPQVALLLDGVLVAPRLPQEAFDRLTELLRKKVDMLTESHPNVVEFFDRVLPFLNNPMKTSQHGCDPMVSDFLEVNSQRVSHKLGRNAGGWVVTGTYEKSIIL